MTMETCVQTEAKLTCKAKLTYLSFEGVLPNPDFILIV